MARGTETGDRSTRERDLTPVADAIYAFLRGEHDARVHLDQEGLSDRMRELVSGVNELGEKLAKQGAEWQAKLEPLQQTEYRNALCEAITESSLDGILVADGEGKALSTNKRFTEMWRIPSGLATTALFFPRAFLRRV